MREKIWFFIKPHTFVSKSNQNNCLLLYNTENGNFIETNDEHIINVVNILHEQKNLGTTLLDGNDMLYPAFYLFIQEAIKKDLCGTIPYESNESRPIQLMPVLSIQRDVEKLKKKGLTSYLDNTLAYLTEITLYVNGFCEQNCIYCDKIYKQLNYCTKGVDTTNLLDLSSLEHIAKQIKYAPVNTINIFGGDIFKYPFYKQLDNIFSSQNRIIYYWSNYRNFGRFSFG